MSIGDVGVKTGTVALFLSMDGPGSFFFGLISFIDEVGEVCCREGIEM